ncbi:MAG TPA: hypothetical protein VGJ82_21775 [Thermoanaerobaculia bacterium]|jgi:hypothetical protein
MKVLGAFSHGVIDYLMVIILAVGPGVAGFTGKQATICYALALVHFLLTFITRFPLGVMKTLPFWLHGSVEIVVAVLLVILPWLGSFSAGVLSRNFFVAIGVLIAVIWALTNYRSAGRAAAASKPAP